MPCSRARDGGRGWWRVVTADDLPDWYWRVVVYTDECGELVLSAMEPHRTAAKQYIVDQLEVEVVEWRRCYIPRPSWDCPVCGVHEGASKVPNLRGDYDWECLSCRSKMWGEPMDWDRIDEGTHLPGYRSAPSTSQTKLGDSDV